MLGQYFQWILSCTSFVPLKITADTSLGVTSGLNFKTPCPILTIDGMRDNLSHQFNNPTHFTSDVTSESPKHLPRPTRSLTLRTIFYKVKTFFSSTSKLWSIMKHWWWNFALRMNWRKMWRLKRMEESWDMKFLDWCNWLSKAAAGIGQGYRQENMCGSGRGRLHNLGGYGVSTNTSGC